MEGERKAMADVKKAIYWKNFNKDKE